MNPKTQQDPDAADVQTSAPATLPPVPGGGSWRPNAAGDGWVENTPAAEPEAAPAPAIPTHLETTPE